MKTGIDTFSRCTAASALLALVVYAYGCAASAAPAPGPQQTSYQATGPGFGGGEIIRLVMPRRADYPTPYSPFAFGYESPQESQFVQARDATEMVQAVMIRELGAAGYQPLPVETRADGGSGLGIRSEVTRVRTTQVGGAGWPAPTPFFHTLISAHVVVFRDDADCYAQSYFAHGEGQSAWSAFSIALDRVLKRSVPESIAALPGCGKTPELKQY